MKRPLTISARRYLAHGVWHTVFLVYFLRFAYWLGVPPQKLKKLVQGRPGEVEGRG